MLESGIELKLDSSSLFARLGEDAVLSFANFRETRRILLLTLPHDRIMACICALSSED